MTISRNSRAMTVTDAAGTAAAQPNPEHGTIRRRGVRSRPGSPQSPGFFQPLPPLVWLMAGILALFGIFTINRGLTPASVLVLPLLGTLFWRRGEPQILFYACAMQWLRVVTPVFYSDFQGISLEEVYDVPEMEKAIWLSLIGVLILAFGIRLVLKHRFGSPAEQAEREASRLSISRLFLGWLAVFGVAIIAGAIAWKIPGLTQPIYALTSLKWVFFFILGYTVLSRQAGYGLLLTAVLIEFLGGLTGYFSGFKEVFLNLAVIALSTRALPGSRSRAWMLLVVLAIVVLVTSVFWTAIKMDYRSYLNQRSGDQQVSGTVSARFQKQWELLSDVDADKLSDSVEALVFRVSYMEYFARTLSYVPDKVPYENGKLWLDAVKRIFMPRLFFPEKQVTDDSNRTAIYTGTSIAGSEQGTSIGIGYMGESYIDFGPHLMFLPIFLLGLFFGLIYRYFVFHNRSRLLGFAIATTIIFPFSNAIEISNIKILGGTVTVCLVMLVFNFFLGDKVMNWLLEEQPKARRPIGDHSSRKRLQTADENLHQSDSNGVG